jgi:hypothetical protein
VALVTVVFAIDSAVKFAHAVVAAAAGAAPRAMATNNAPANALAFDGPEPRPPLGRRICRNCVDIFIGLLPKVIA